MIKAELIDSETASACGISVCTPSPIIALCKALVAAGHDSRTPLEARRGSTPVRRAKRASGPRTARRPAMSAKKRWPRRSDPGDLRRRRWHSSAIYAESTAAPCSTKRDA
jgi:hypothetical protein